MLILGIETSCDETAAAVIEGRNPLPRVLSNIIASQIDLHATTGGVVPEVAAREHVVNIMPVVDRALREAGDMLGHGLALDDIDLIAVTFGPGLISSLVTGAVTASTLGIILGKPVIPVNHIEGHLYSNFVPKYYTDGVFGNPMHDLPDVPEFPILVLTVSGGHNELVLMRGHGDYEVIGETLDDAAGEAFDKGARLLGLSYPGGPAIQEAAAGGDPHAYELPRGLMTERAKHRAAVRKRAREYDKSSVCDVGDFDFSFSGLKTALSRLVERECAENAIPISNLAASLQEAICDALSRRLIQAAIVHNPRELHLAGGVSANLRLRELVREKMSAAGLDMPLRWPVDISYCTDNAAMIAVAGYFCYLKNPKKHQKWQPVEARPNADLK